MNRPADLVAIPPLARTVIYYVLAIALVVIGALVGYDRLEPLYLVITSGVAGVFFGVAGSNVSQKPDTTTPDVGTPENPLAVEVQTDPEAADVARYVETNKPEKPLGGVWGGT